MWYAFLRGINLGKRQIKMAALKTCLEAAGCTAVKTVLASGNVRFQAPDSADAVRKKLEKAMADQFGFDVGIVLRSETEMQSLLDNHPFGQLDPEADVARHVALFETPLPGDLVLPDRPGHTEILRIDSREIYLAGYRQPNGRYTEGMDDALRPLDKKTLVTMRNWNTMERMLK